MQEINAFNRLAAGSATLFPVLDSRAVSVTTNHVKTPGISSASGKNPLAPPRSPPHFVPVLMLAANPHKRVFFKSSPTAEHAAHKRYLTNSNAERVLTRRR